MCGDNRGQFHAIRNTNPESLSVIRDLRAAFRLAFKQHGVVYKDCFHIYLRECEPLFRLSGKDLISAAKNSLSNFMSMMLHQEAVPGSVTNFFSERTLNRIRHSVWRTTRNGQKHLRSRGLGFLMSILQSKRAVGLVPEELLQSSLAKNFNCLTQVQAPEVSEKAYKHLFPILREFALNVKVSSSIPVPTKKSNTWFTCREGGYQGYYKDSSRDQLSIVLEYDGDEYVIPPKHDISLNISGTDGDRISLISTLFELYGPISCQNLTNKMHLSMGKPIGVKTRQLSGYPVNCVCDNNKRAYIAKPEWIDIDKWCQQPLQLEYMKVRTVGLPEPLKVRVITKSHPMVYLLKMLQSSMTKTLNEKFPVFSLTGSDTVENAVKSVAAVVKNERDKYFISGDYDAATDNMPLDIIRYCMEVIMKYCKFPIDFPPHLRKILSDIIYLDSTPHLVESVFDGEIHQGIQQNGQLMGSFLSFPILCLVNLATVSLSSGNNPRKDWLYRDDIKINGDDLLFAGTETHFQSWKECVKSFGLQLSVGKNYFSKHFGTINSRVFSATGLTVDTLRYGNLFSKNNVLDDWSAFSEIAYDEASLMRTYHTFKCVRARDLRKSNVGLFVPYCLGGPLPNYLFEFVPNRFKNQIKMAHVHNYLKQIGKSLWIESSVKLAYQKMSTIYSDSGDTKSSGRNLWIRVSNADLRRVEDCKLTLQEIFDELKDKKLVRLLPGQIRSHLKVRLDYRFKRFLQKKSILMDWCQIATSRLYNLWQPRRIESTSSTGHTHMRSTFPLTDYIHQRSMNLTTVYEQDDE